MDKKVKLSLNKTMVSRLQNNEQNSIWDMVDSTEAPVVHQSVMR